MRNFIQSIYRLISWRRWGVAFAAGGLSVLAMAPIFAWPILFATLSVLVWLLDGANVQNLEPATGWKILVRRNLALMWRAGVTGWMFGFGYFLFGLYWIGEAFLVEAEKFAWLLPFAVSLMPAGLALFYGLATALSALFWRCGPARIIALALGFLSAEWLRGRLFTGFPWNSLGYGLTGTDALMQSASVFGIDGLAFFAILIFASPAILMDGKAGRAGPIRWRFPAAMLLVLIMAAIAGHIRLGAPPSGATENVRLRIVQPNIPQIEKWKPDNRLWIFQRHLDLSRRNAALAEDGLDGVTHLIWPEAASPFFLAESKDALQLIAELLPASATLLTGAIRFETVGHTASGQEKRNIFNSIYVMDHEAKILSVYDKIHLVPFGEYLPFQQMLEAIGLEQLTRLRGGFAAGPGPRFLKAPGVPDFSPLICYEIIFSGAVNEGTVRSTWLLNVTNDAWFGQSAGPHQHFHQARVRAVEEGLPLVRAANTGISAIVDPYGRVLHKLSLNTQGVIDGDLPKPLAATSFSQHRGLTLFILVFVAIAMLIFLSKDEGDAFQ